MKNLDRFMLGNISIALEWVSADLKHWLEAATPSKHQRTLIAEVHTDLRHGVKLLRLFSNPTTKKRLPRTKSTTSRKKGS